MKLLYFCTPEFWNTPGSIKHVRMYAIVNIAGQQFKVEKDQRIFVHRLEGKEGDKLNFDEVLLIDNDKTVLVGEPLIKGARITGKVISHAKGDKVQVFKKKKRKGYQVQTGHRQYLTEIRIQEILEKTAAPKKETTSAKPASAKGPEAKAKAEKAPAAKTATGKKATEKPQASKAPAAKSATSKASGSKTAAKKPATKKPVAKKDDAPAAGDKKESKS